MKAAELRAKSYQELDSLLEELRREQMNLRFQKSLGQLTKPHLLSIVKQNIARTKTVMHELRMTKKWEDVNVS